ncbi:MAG: hypothetical protein K2H96_03675 [Muribaculaceae bacterium]|nr:hypothetical protein [Muribaculaceae bacterium]
MSQTNKESTAEEKGAMFLNWVAEHQGEMRKALKKNCTYDPDIFDDVFGETVLSVHSTIVKNNREIDNIKNYFFLALKWKYQTRQNQKRKQQSATFTPDDWESLGGLDDGEEREAIEQREVSICDALTIMRECLVEEFGEEMTELFFSYWTQKTVGGASYQRVLEHHPEPNRAQRILFEMKRYVSEELSYLTKALHQ